MLDAFNQPEKPEELVEPGAIQDAVEANLRSEQSTNCQPCEIFASSARERRNLLRRGLRSKLFALGSNVGVDSAKAAGASCVGKSKDRLRLTCDRRSRNAVESCLQKVKVSGPVRFTKVLLPKSHVLRMSGRGLLHSERGATIYIRLGGFVQPLARTLVMGGINAVLIAQVAHVGGTAQSWRGIGRGDICSSVLFPRGAVCGGSRWCEGALRDPLWRIH